MPSEAGTGLGREAAAEVASTVTVRVPVFGMTCQGCATGVRMSLEQLPAVQDVRVDLERNEVEVRGGGSLEEPTIRDAVAALGYQLEAPNDGDADDRMSTRRWIAGLLAIATVLVVGTVAFREASAMYLVGDTITALIATFSDASAAALGLALLFGLVVAFAPSTYAIAPAVMGYVTNTEVESPKRASGLAAAFVGGMVVVDMVVGAVFAVGGAAAMRYFTARLPLWYAVATVVLVAMGLFSLKLWRPRLPSYVPRPRTPAGPMGAFLTGIPFGLMACPSCTPLLLPVALGAAATGEPLYGAALMGAFAIGRGVPLVALGTLSGATRTARGLARWVPTIERAVGVLALAAAGWFGWAFVDAGGFAALL